MVSYREWFDTGTDNRLVAATAQTFGKTALVKFGMHREPK
jgi:hypothetical protein